MIIEAKGLKKRYRNGDEAVEVIRGVDLSVEQGEFVSIVGQSGSGKSTLLYLLAGIETPSEGTVELLGVPLATATEKQLTELRRSGFSFVYQFDNLLPNLTVRENIELPLLLAGAKPSAQKIDELLSYMEIEGTANKYPRMISGGEQQRAALARALTTDAKLIFLDEPTGSLDAKSGEKCMELLKKINQEKSITIVQVTHSREHAEYSSRIVKISDGIIV